MAHSRTTAPSSATDRRRVAAATIVGTTIEWYDFFIYANAASIIFAELFFKPAGEQLAQVLSFITVGISFLFRPLGAVLVGHFGDKIGRKAVLVITLILMGAATTLIGVLPDYATIGVWAPILLMLLRVVQGISAGGEWGGAVLMAVEHAPVDKRGRYGMYPQLGVPIGMLIATGVLAVVRMSMSPEAFSAWGWRLPFLLSIVLIIVGYIVRRSVEESPVFEELADRGKERKMPVVELFRKHWALVILLALVFAGNNASGYMITGGYLLNYTTKVLEPPLDAGVVLNLVTLSAFVWFLSTLLSGYLADWIGAKRTYVIGYLFLIVMVFPLFWMVDTGDVPIVGFAMCLFAIGLGLTYGPQASWYAESYPASVRTSGVSISYALGAILGGAFAPTIAALLVDAFGTTMAVAFYLLCLAVIALSAVLLLRERRGIPLGIEFEESGEFEVWEPERKPARIR